MKYSFVKLSISIFLILLCYVHSTYMKSATEALTFIKKSENADTSSESTAVEVKTESQAEFQYEESEAKFFAKFAKNANCAEKPLSKSCSDCLQPKEGYKFFFYFQTTRMKKYNYKLMIHYNDDKKKVAVTFGGPDVQEHHNYVKFIYAKGFSLVKLYKINVEREYALIYFGKLRKILLKKVDEIKKSGRFDYQFVFNGYSIGGSLATLAAFDLTRQEVIHNPQVYSFGALRLGDAAFVAMVNTTVKVWRVVKAGDYIVRIPSCYYSPMLKLWRCFSQPIIKKFIMQRSFPLRAYVRNYVTLYRTNNPILRKALKIHRSGKDSKALKNKKGGKKGKKSLKKSRKSKKSGKKSKTSKSKPKKAIRKLKSLNKRKRAAKKILKKLLKKNSFKKLKKKINRRTLKKLKVLSKKQIKNIIKKKAMKKIIKLVKNSKKKGQNPHKAVGKKVEKIKKVAKRIIKKINKAKKSSKSKKSKAAKRSSKKKDDKKDEIDQKTKKDKKDKKKDKKEKKNEKSQSTSPIKKVSDIKKPLPTKPKSSTTSVSTPIVSTTVSFFVPTESSITIVRNYSPLQIYFNFIYYTQPIGYMIYYNDEMTTYKTCEYMGGVSICEKVVTLPSSFAIDTHTHYFGIRFDDCPIDKSL
jgi:hypothetical protein